MRKFQTGWLRAYKHYVAQQESPDIFHYWIALQTISGTLKRRVWIDRGAYKLYPNMYLILVTDSGACRKSVAMEIGMDLLREIPEVTIVSERASLEGLMDKMQRVEIVDGKARPDGSVFIHADELSDLFGKAAYITDLMSFLTAAYSSRSRLEFLTRNRGLCSVRNPCPCMLSGTTPEGFGTIFPTAITSSGFLGRILLVTGSRARRIAKPQIRHEMKPNLVLDLRMMGSLSGEIKLSPEAEHTYTTWYENLPEYNSRVLPSFYERKHDHVLKTALLISVSESNDMVISNDHILDAFRAIDLVESRFENAMRFIGATQESIHADTIVKIVMSGSPNPVSYSDIMRKMYRKVKGAAELKAILEILVESKRLRRVVKGRAVFYTL